MKKLIFSSLAALVAVVAHAAPADDVSAAAKKLADAPNYAWTRTQEVANSQFNFGPSEGATEKDGFTVTKASFNGNDIVTARKGDQRVTKGQDGNWLTPEELRAQFQGGGGGNGGGGRGGRGGGFGGGQQNPAEELAALVGQTKDLKATDGIITGTLSEEAVAPRLSLGGGRGGQTPPAPKNASGTAKFWLKDGAITKYQTHVKGTVAGRDGDMERDVTVTIELKNVGSTKVDVPAEAKKKFN
jgi:hypothetical protein